MRQLWLFFKQGTKSIFKQKMQFFVLIILSFLSVFYLVTSSAITTRMSKIYDDVMNGYERFDYTYSKKADESNLLDKNDTYLPILDFINEDINYVNNKGASEFESFNVIYNNNVNDKKNSSFITRVFFNEDGKPTEQLKGIWNNKHNGSTNAWESLWYPLSRWEFQNTGASYFLASKLDFNFKNGIPGLYGEMDEWWQSNNTSITKFSNQMTVLLAKSLWDELDTISKKKENENLTLFEKYFINNNLLLGVDFKDPTKNENNGQLSIEELQRIEVKNIAKTKTEVYIYNALESISFEILDTLSTFAKDSFSNTLGSSELKENLNGEFPWEKVYEDQNELQAAYKDFINKFNETAEHLGGTKIASYDVSGLVPNDYNESITEYNMNLIFAYIFGTLWDETKLNVNNPENSGINKYLYSEDGMYYVVKGESTELENQINQGLDNDNNKIILKSNEIDYGKRGLANPMSVEYSTNSKSVTAFYSKNNFQPFEKLAKGTKIASEFNGKWSNKNDVSYENKSVYSMNIMHQEMAAQESGLDILLREEAYFYDREQKWNFRFIIVNDAKEFNYTITAGLEAVTANEIVISQQFAMRNNFEVGDKIKIGNSNFIISGFGVDALTYYPLGDPEIPISDTSSNALVYIPKNIITDMMGSGIANETIFSTLYFLKERPESEIVDKAISGLSKEEKITLYDSLISLNKNKLQSAKDRVDNNQLTGDFINKSIKDFNKSNHALSWDLQPQILKVVKIFSAVASAIILIMVLFTLTFTIKKVIDRNASQIGYLKAIGVNSRSLAVSYLGYAIIIGLIVVPLAWVSAGLFQEVISKLFAVYFSTTMYEFVFDWRILAFTIFIFEIVALLSSYLISLWLTRKPALKIINHDSGSSGKAEKKYSGKKSLFSNMSFKYRFPIKVSIRGWKQIITTSAAVLISTLIITFAATLPATLSIYVNDSTKNINYKNKYISNDKISNMPTARTAISPTLGIPELETMYSEPKALNEVSNIYFDKSQLYGDSNWDTTMFPKIVLDNDGNAEWFEEAVLRPVQVEEDAAGVGSSLLATILLGAIGKTTNLNGFSFSTGTFESIVSYVLNSNINPETGNEIDPSWTQQQIADKKIKWMIDASVLLNEVIPNIIEMFKGKLEQLVGEEIIPSKNWKQDILMLASSFLPSAGMQYLNDSPNRLSQFIIGMNVENYTPGKETLATEAKVKINENQSLIISGLKNGQRVFNLDQRYNDSLYINDLKTFEDLNKLFKIEKEDFNKDIFMPNGFKLFDANSRTLNLPVATNKKYESTMSLNGSAESITSINNTVVKLGGIDGITMPSNAWVYDNRIVSKSPKIKEQLKSINGDDESVINHLTEDWINIEKIPTNRMTLQNLFDIYSSDEPELTGAATSLFIDTWIDNEKKSDVTQLSEDKIQYGIRPEYQMSNIKMFVPSSLIGEGINAFLQNDRFADLTKIKNYKSFNEKDKDYLDVFKEGTWAGTVDKKIVKDMIPQQAIDAWGKQYMDEDWLWVAPYHPSAHRDSEAKNGIVSNLTEVSHAMPWISRAMNRTGSALTISNTEEIPPFINDIKLKSVGTIDTYNGDIFIVDQDMLNLLMGMSTEKYIPANYDFYGDVEKVFTVGSGKDTTKMNMYETRTPSEQIEYLNSTNDYYMRDELVEKGIDPFNHIIQNRDYTTKYSEFDEAFGVTGGFKAINSETPGLLNPEKFEDMNVLYKEVNFVGHTLGMIVTLAESILLVSIFLIVGILMIVALIISILSDIFVTKYTKFIVTMRSMGYSKKSIVVDTMLIAGLFNIVMISIGFGLGIYFLGLLLQTLQISNIFIPLTMYWWLPIIIILGIAVIIAISGAFSLRKTFKVRLTSLT